jgi:ABC-type xylose transport system substrate-binding protein
MEPSDFRVAAPEHFADGVPTTKTIGMVAVAALAAMAAGGAIVIIAAAGSATSSTAIAGKRSKRPSAETISDGDVSPFNKAGVLEPLPNSTDLSIFKLDAGK